MITDTFLKICKDIFRLESKQKIYKKIITDINYLYAYIFNLKIV